MTLHPNYATNKRIYAGYTYDKDGVTHVKIIRFKDEGTSISGVTTMTACALSLARTATSTLTPATVTAAVRYATTTTKSTAWYPRFKLLFRFIA